MAAAIDPSAAPDPKFITYLFSLKRYECHFVVGNKDLAEPVRIGVVKEMLMAHSDVLRSDMLQKEIEDKKSVNVTDLEPHTFENLLKYVYGYDNTDSLCFDEADNLLYAAEKYMIEPLKARVVTRLSTLLSPDNICTLLNNPVCHRALELDLAVSRILQHETDKVLASPLFLDLSPDALTKVFEQEAMNVPEIEVWRAAVKWAKQRTNSEEGQALRKALEGPAKQIRVCTIDENCFVDEVYPVGILTEKEVNIVAFSKLNKKKRNDLMVFSNEIEQRITRLPTCQVDFFVECRVWYHNTYGEMSVVTKQLAIELLPFKMKAEKWVGNGFIPKLTYEFQCTIIISRITDHKNDTSSEPPQTVEVCQQVEYDTEFTIPVTREGRNIVLSPHNKYTLEMNFNVSVPIFFIQDSKPYNTEYISVTLLSPGNHSIFPFQTLFYQPLYHDTVSASLDK